MPACPTFLCYLFKPDFENRKYSVIMSFNFMAAAPHFYITVSVRTMSAPLYVDHKIRQLKSVFHQEYYSKDREMAKVKVIPNGGHIMVYFQWHSEMN